MRVVLSPFRLRSMRRTCQLGRRLSNDGRADPAVSLPVTTAGARYDVRFTCRTTLKAVRSDRRNTARGVDGRVSSMGIFMPGTGRRGALRTTVGSVPRRRDRGERSSVIGRGRASALQAAPGARWRPDQYPERVPRRPASRPAARCPLPDDAREARSRSVGLPETRGRKSTR